MKKLESERLYFELLDEKHFEYFCTQEMDAEVMKYIRMPSGSQNNVRSKFDGYIAYMIANPNLGVWTAFRKSDNKPVGLVVLFHLEMKPEHGKYEVGYRLEKASWGQGYATEITHALLEYGFNELGLIEIYGTTHPDNVVSQKVLMKAGMKDLGLTPLRGGSRFFCIKRDEYFQPRG